MAGNKVQQIIAAKDQAPLACDLGHTALLVIDAQRDFAQPQYAFAQALEKVVPGVTDDYFARTQQVALPNIARLQRFFRERKRPIFYTATGTSTGDGSDLAGWLRGFDALGQMVLGRNVWPRPGDEAWDIDDSVRPAPGEMVVNKIGASAFVATPLDQTFRALGIQTLVVCGFSTDVCVSSSARHAADCGYQVIVVEDACATLSEEMHRVSLDAIALAFGRVRSTQQVLQLLTPQRTATAS